LAKGLILIFFLVIIPSVGAQYGEDSPALGQFVDDYTDTNNISVAVDVVRNSTIDAIELNVSALTPDYENFTTYSVVDENADLTITDLEILFSSVRRDADTYVSYDYGVNHFGDFVHYVDVNLTDVEAGDGTSRGIVIFWDVSNDGGDWDTVLASDVILATFVQDGANDDVYRFQIAWREGGVSQGVSTGVLRSVNTEWYLIMNRTDDDFKMEIYSDSARTNLNETLSINNIASTQFRYVHGLCAYAHAGDPADHGSGTIQNLWLGNYSGGYEASGYFITTDYLNYVDGSSLVDLNNATIPANTAITVQYSSDGSTWVNSSGVAGHNDLVDGFSSIDLRPLNYSAGFYKMVNETSSDNSITPSYEQSRLITTDAGVTVSDPDLSPLVVGLMIGLIIGVGIYLVGGNK
jgi:hypothetical protein